MTKKQTEQPQNIESFKSTIIMCIRLWHMMIKVPTLFCKFPYQMLLITFFLLVIFSSIINSMGSFIPPSEVLENRVPTKKPSFSNDHPEKFASDYNKYFSDNFSLRSNYVQANSWIKYFIFKSSPIDSIILGKNDMLFYDSDAVHESHSIANYRLKASFSAQKLEQMWKKLSDTTNYLKSKNIGFCFFIAPDKVNIYPEFMPDYLTKGNGENNSDQVLKLPPKWADLPVIDLRPALLEAKKKHPIYYWNGTHWNEYGAMVAYMEIMHKIRENFPYLHQYTEQDFLIFEGRGEMDNIMCWAGLHKMMSGKETFVRFAKKSKVKDKLPKLVIYGDSFIVILQQFMELSFKQALFFHHQRAFVLDKSMIEKEKPDFVILEITERYLDTAL